MSKYRGENGVLLTQGLFYEWNNPDAPYTLRDTGNEPFYESRAGKKYQSVPWLYRNSDSEYECAISMLGSWEHWKKLCGQKWFETGVVKGVEFSGLNAWREEKKLADETKAKKVILKAIQDGDLQAAKFLFDRTTNKEVGKKGRPEKKLPSKQGSSVLDIAKRIQAK